MLSNEKEVFMMHYFHRSKARTAINIYEESFATVVNGFWLLTIVEMLFILDVCRFLGYASVSCDIFIMTQNLYMLHSIPTVLISYSTLFVLHYFQVALSNGAQTQCSILFMVHSFMSKLSSCGIFSCCSLLCFMVVLSKSIQKTNITFGVDKTEELYEPKNACSF